MKKVKEKYIEVRRLKKHYVPPVKDYSKVEKGSKTIPDQSLSIAEIIKRFVRGIPVDIVQRDPVYIDQNDHDLEALSRKDFAEKHEIANAMRERNEQIEADIKATNERILGERKEAKVKAERKRVEGERKNTGIDSLDNTMPVDTTKN